MQPSFPRRGEIHLVRLPGHPLDRKSRPALIVSVDVRNRLAHDVMVVPLSTTLRPAPTHVVVKRGEGGVRCDSMAKCEQVTTLDKSLLIRGPFADVVPEDVMSQVERGIMRAIGLVL